MIKLSRPGGFRAMIDGQLSSALTAAAAAGAIQATIVLSLTSPLGSDPSRVIVMAWLSAALAAMLGYASCSAITLRRKAQRDASLRKHMLIASRDGVLVIDADGTVREANGPASEIIGLPIDKLVGRSIYDPAVFLWREDGTTVNPGDRPTRQLLSGSVVECTRFRAVTSLRECWVEASGVPLPGADGSIGGAILILRDVTHEMALRTVAEEQALDFVRIANEIPTLLYLTDPEGNTIFHNAAWGTFLLGDASRSVAGCWYEHMSEQDRRRVLEAEDRACARREGYSETYRMRRHDGELVWFLDVGVPRFDSNGVFLGYVGCMTDISEVQLFKSRIGPIAEVGLQAEIMRSALGRVSGAIDDLIAAFGDMPSGEALADQAGARSALDRLRAQIAQASGGGGLRRRGHCGDGAFAEVVVEDAVRHALSLVELGLSEAHKVVLEANCRARIVACPGLLNSLIGSLILNARDAMPSGGEIRVSVRDVDARDLGWWSPGGADWFKIEVRDAGSGIDASVLNEVTKPFWTSKQGAIGMGLPWVDQAVRSAGGRLTIESVRGLGTTVCLYFPAAATGRICIDGAPCPAGDGRDAAPLPGGRGERILLNVSDDRLGICLADELKRLGYVPIRGGEDSSVSPDIDLVISDAMVSCPARTTGAASKCGCAAESAIWIGGSKRADLEAHGLLRSDDIYVRIPHALRDLAEAVRDGVARKRAALWRH